MRFCNPIVLLGISSAIGAVLGSCRPTPENGLAAGILLAGWLSWLGGLRRTLIPILLIASATLSASRISTLFYTAPPAGEPWPGLPDEKVVFQAKAVGHSVRTEKGFRLKAHILAWRDHSSWKPMSAVASLSFDGPTAPNWRETFRFESRLRTPRNLGNEFGWDQERFSRIRGIDLSGSVEPKSWALLEPAGVERVFSRFRSSFEERVETFLAGEKGSLLLSLVLGESAGLSSELIRAFRRTGLAHLLVVSGFQIAGIFGVVVAGMMFLFRRSAWCVSRRYAQLGAIFLGALAATGFSLITTLEAPVLRALTGLCLVVLAIAFLRPTSPIKSFFTLVALWAVIFPVSLFDVSAQLSFSAVGGILWAMHIFRAVDFSPWRKRILQGLLATLGASIATIPILAFHFCEISLWTIPFNMIFGPLIGAILTGAGLVALALDGPLRPIGDFLLCAIDPFLEISIRTLEFLSEWPGTHFITGRPPLPAIAGTFLVLIVIGFGLRKRWVCVCILTTLCALAPCLSNLRNEVHLLHVGQGDAILVLGENGKVVLIDTGTAMEGGFDAGRNVILPWLRSHRIRKIDVMVITHDDLDHFGGAKSIIDEFPVGEIWVNSRWSSQGMRAVRNAAAAHDIAWRELAAPRHVEWEKNFNAEMIYPAWRDLDGAKNDNDRSLVLRVKLGGATFLFTGDMEREAEQILLKRNVDVHADFLKVAHHGSQTSSTKNFLKAVNPWGAWNSAGWKNRFHHPHPSVLSRIAHQKVHLWRGDLCGEVVTHVGPNSIETKAVRACTTSVY